MKENRLEYLQYSNCPHSQSAGNLDHIDVNLLREQIRQGWEELEKNIESLRASNKVEF